MRFHQITQEWSDHHPDIHQSLVQRGYKLLGKGVDQRAYLEPGTGHVLKIFGTDEFRRWSPGEKPVLPPSQRMFVTFAKYCEAHQDNPHLPRIYGWETFYWSPRWPHGPEPEYKHLYLQIRTERLGVINHNSPLREIYSQMSERIAWSKGSFENFEAWLLLLKNSISRRYQQLFSEPAARQRLEHLYNTMQQLKILGSAQGYHWDLHSANIMQRRDGTPVITDPWVV